MMLNFNLKQLCGPENKGLIVSVGYGQTDRQMDKGTQSTVYNAYGLKHVASKQAKRTSLSFPALFQAACLVC